MSGTTAPPFRKLFASHLQAGHLSGDLEAGWTLRHPDFTEPLRVKNVWLQGIVRNVTKNGDTLELTDDDRDASNAVIVTRCRSVPGCRSWQALKGRYAQVLGSLHGVDGHQTVQIRAIKILDLSEADNHDVFKLMWPNEVRELIKFSS